VFLWFVCLAVVTQTYEADLKEKNDRIAALQKTRGVAERELKECVSFLNMDLLGIVLTSPSLSLSLSLSLSFSLSLSLSLSFSFSFSLSHTLYLSLLSLSLLLHEQSVQ
jgi:hypothetical protein